MEEKRQFSKVYRAIPLEIETVGRKILDAAYTVHTALGPGLLESVYEACTAYEARQNGVKIETQVALPVKYKEVYVETGLRLDLWAEKSVIVEVKAVEKVNPLYEAQLLTYLKMTGCRLGFLINFNVKHLKDGIQRIVL